MLGPILGVAAIVAAVGLTDSAKGDLKQKLRELGHQPHRRGGQLVVRHRDADAARRRGDRGRSTVPTVDQVVGGVRAERRSSSRPTRRPASVYETVPVPVLAADYELPVRARGGDA